MSAAHPFLRFTTEGLVNFWLLADWANYALPWQRQLAGHNAWPGLASRPATLAAATAISQTLGILAATAVFSAAVGPSLADIGPQRLGFAVGPHLYPTAVQVAWVSAAPGSATQRLAQARAAFDTLAQPLAQDFPTLVRFGAHQRASMAHDAWALALRDARGLIGGSATVSRESCCYLYLVPGTRLCAGCPRLT